MPTDECRQILQSLHDAVLALVRGERVASVMFSDRQATYSQAQLKDLQAIYQRFYAQCGAESGLPNLSMRAERGPPATYRMN